jgi:hypothetical protein
MRIAAPWVLFFALAASPALAQAEDCYGFDALGPDVALSIAAIVDAAPRVNFVKNGSIAKGCRAEQRLAASGPSSCPAIP